MKSFFPILFFLLSHANSFSQDNQDSSNADATLLRQLTLSGFCLCATSIRELSLKYPDLKPVLVEEMDLCPGGFSTDGRFENGKGFATEKVPGIIFQKDQSSDRVSKIRLTKKYHGKLPNGTEINMDTLKLKDVFAHYPKYIRTWGSRGCETYFAFSTDTIVFFVKIDSGKKLQFPLNESIYLEKPVAGVDFVFSCYNMDHLNNNTPNEPVYFVDSVRWSLPELKFMQSDDVEQVTVLKDSSALAVLGYRGKYGILYIMTRKFARQKCWKFLSGKSAAYLNLVPDWDDFEKCDYVLDGEWLTKNPASKILSVNEDNFISLKIREGSLSRGKPALGMAKKVVLITTVKKER